MSKDGRDIRHLRSCHIEHVCAMMIEANLTPLNKYQVEFLLTEPTCEFIGLFKDEEEDTTKQQPLGVACLMSDGETTFLSLLIVDSKHRRQGIGELLTRWAIDKSKASEAQPKALILTASPLGAPIYSRIGFKTFAYASLYKISSENQQKKQKKGVTSGHRIRSFYPDSLASASDQDKEIWKQAFAMMTTAMHPLEGKISRFSSYVQPFVCHLLCQSTDGESKVVAWCAVGRFSSTSRVIGPIFGSSAANVAELISRVVDEQIDFEKSIKRFLLDEEIDAEFHLHTDSQSGEEASLITALEKDSWERVARGPVMAYDLGRWNEADKRPTSGPRQFALADFSEG